MKSLPKKSAVPDVTKTMLECLQAMLAASEKSLYRWQGGFWAVNPRPASLSGCVPEVYFTTGTVHGLIVRGAVDVAQTMGGSQKFPTRVRLNHVSYEVLKCKQSKN